MPCSWARAPHASDEGVWGLLRAGRSPRRAPHGASALARREGAGGIGQLPLRGAASDPGQVGGARTGGAHAGPGGVPPRWLRSPRSPHASSAAESRRRGGRWVRAGTARWRRLRCTRAGCAWPAPGARPSRGVSRPPLFPPLSHGESMRDCASLGSCPAPRTAGVPRFGGYALFARILISPQISRSPPGAAPAGRRWCRKAWQGCTATALAERHLHCALRYRTKQYMCAMIGLCPGVPANAVQGPIRIAPRTVSPVEGPFRPQMRNCCALCTRNTDEPCSTTRCD